MAVVGGIVVIALVAAGTFAVFGGFTPGPEVVFTNPPQRTALHLYGDVTIDIMVSGLPQGTKLWFLSQSEGSAEYFTISDSALTDMNGRFTVTDSHVGSGTDIGHVITYFPIVANDACDSELELYRQDNDKPPPPAIETLSPQCTVLPGFEFSVVA